jgi:hypothetical protein
LANVATTGAWSLVPTSFCTGHETTRSASSRLAQIYQAAADDAFDERPLLWKLSDRARLALLGMDISLRERDIQIAAHHERPSGCLERRGVLVHRPEEAHLGGEVLAAVRHVHRRDCDTAHLDGHDAILVIEFGMGELRPLGRHRLVDVKADARISLAAVPVAPVALHLAQGRWHLIGRRLDFLQADDVRTLTRHPLQQLCVARPDAVDVPGRNFHQLKADS